MYFERKQQERTSSVAASRHPSEGITSHRRKKPKVSQDVLAFRMQSEINSKNDVGTGCNFRVVKLGRTSSLPPAKKGANVTSCRRVDSVFLPLSPMEMPSALDLSYSPNGSVPGSSACQLGETTTKMANMPYTGSRDSHGSSSIIDLFGVLVEKPVKTQKSVSSDESKHKYCVNSDRVCRKASCSMIPNDLMSVTADINLPKGRNTNRSNTLSSDQVHTFQFTKPDIFNQNPELHFKRVPSITGSDNETCYSEPLLNCASRSACEKWCNMSDTDVRFRQDMSYIPQAANILSSTRLSNTGFTVGRDSQSFEVNLVNSPKRGEPAGNTVSTPTNNDKDHQLGCSCNAKECSIPDSDHSVRNDIFENRLYSDCLIPNDTEFYAEVPDKIEDIVLISSPRSPPKPVFLPYNQNCYSPLDNGNMFDKPRLYARKEDIPTVDEHTVAYVSRENREPLRIWNQERQEIDFYELPSNFNTDKENQVYSRNNGNDVFHTFSERYQKNNNDHRTFSNTYFGELQPLPRNESYIISSRLDCETNVGLTSHSRFNNGCNNASSFGWRPALESDVHQTGRGRRKTTSTASAGENSEDKTSRECQPPGLNIKGTRAVMYSQPTASCSSHGLPLSSEDLCQDIHNRTGTKTHENITKCLPDPNLLSTPLMTSTPRCEQNGNTDSHQIGSAEPATRTSNPRLLINVESNFYSYRRDTQTVSANTVLLEMSMLEKQQASQGGVSDRPPLASYEGEANLVSSFQEGIHSYSPEAPNNQTTNLTPLLAHESATFALPTISSIKSSTDKFMTSQHSDTSLLNTPVTSITSNHARKQSEQSDEMLTERQSSNVHLKEIDPNRYIQSKVKIAGEWSLDCNCNKSCNRKVPAHNPDACLLSQTGIVVCNPTIMTRDNRQHRTSTSTQTSPKFVKDAACSPIKELTQGNLQVEAQTANSADLHNSKVYCLRPRNKTGHPDSVKDTD